MRPPNKFPHTMSQPRCVRIISSTSWWYNMQRWHHHIHTHHTQNVIHHRQQITGQTVNKCKGEAHKTSLCIFAHIRYMHTKKAMHQANKWMILKDYRLLTSMQCHITCFFDHRWSQHFHFCLHQILHIPQEWHTTCFIISYRFAKILSLTNTWAANHFLIG